MNVSFRQKVEKGFDKVGKSNYIEPFDVLNKK